MRVRLSAYPIRIENISQGNNSFQLVHVCPIDHRQKIKTFSAHAFQRQVQRVVGVHMWEVERVEEVAELLGARSICFQCPLEFRPA